MSGASAHRLSFSLAGAALLLVACGGGDDTPDEVTVTLRPLLTDSSLNPAAVREQIAAVAEARAEAYSGADATAEIVGDAIRVTITDVDQETAQALLARHGVLDVRRPLIVEGYIRCKAADGREFLVPPTLVNPDPVSGQLARCFTNSTVGTPLWETATVVDAPGAPPEAISNDSVVTNGWSVDEEPTPGLRAELTADGALLFQEITAELVGYPLGIFIDAQLISVPVIQQPITDGKPIISGFDLEQARLYAAMLNGGVLPVEVQVLQQVNEGG